MPRPTARRCWPRLPPEELLELLPRRLAATTPNTITERTALLAELEQVRATGLAYDREEFSPGIASVGTALRDAVGATAAITVVVPASRFSESETEISAGLLRIRDEIQAVLNGG